MEGHEPANHALWRLLKYWKDNPNHRPGMDFQRLWEDAGRPHTALKHLARMQRERTADNSE